MIHRKRHDRIEDLSLTDGKYRPFGNPKYLKTRVQRKTNAALVTPCLSHLPFHPGCFVGYGAAILADAHHLELIDINAEVHLKNRRKLRAVLDVMDRTQIVSDALLGPFYQEIETHIDSYYASINWEDYPAVYITSPSWFPTVPTEAVLRLARRIKRASERTRIFFFSNSLGSWTSERSLKKNGIHLVHLNNLFAMDSAAGPVRYDLLPTPVYEHREKYLFDLLPFTLKHGCSWGRCRFCSLSRGWNSGYLERSAKAAFKELEVLINRYDPVALVCRDHALNGRNLREFCSYLEGLNKPWCGQSRADLPVKDIEALRRAGCRGIYFGLESGSDRTLRAMNKGLTSKQVSDFIKALHSTGILPAPSLIVGAPGEGREDFEKTVKFMRDHRMYLDVVNVYPYMATPASDFGSRGKESAKNSAVRLFQFIQECGELGLKVCVGEQSIEYTLFRWIHGSGPEGPGGTSIPLSFRSKGGYHG